MAKEICHQPCPECGAFIRVVAQNVNVTLEKQRIRPSPDLPAKSFQAGKPPGVGDWGLFELTEEPRKILRIGGCNGERLWTSDNWWFHRDRLIRIVRRSDALLQKGDRGLLGNIECWITQGEKHSIMEPGFIMIVFSREQISKGDQAEEGAWINRSRFQLTEPVYEKED